MNWNDIKYFLTTAETGNLSEAAMILGASPSTVARRIQELEQSCGAVLFEKRQTGYLLSPAGEGLLPHAERAAAAMQFVERTAGATEAAARPVVKLELPELLGAYVVMPGLGRVAASDPALRFEIANAAPTTRLARRASDLVLRLRRPDSGDYSTRRIGRLVRGLYAAPAYLEARALGTQIDRFDDLRLIGWVEALSHLGTARWFREVTQHAPLWLRTTNLRLQIDAVVAGQGIAALPDFVGAKHGLIRLNRESAESAADIWLLRHAQTAGQPHVDRAADWLERIVADHRPPLAGTS